MGSLAFKRADQYKELSMDSGTETNEKTMSKRVVVVDDKSQRTLKRNPMNVWNECVTECTD